MATGIICRKGTRNILRIITGTSRWRMWLCHTGPGERLVHWLRHDLPVGEFPNLVEAQRVVNLRCPP